MHFGFLTSDIGVRLKKSQIVDLDLVVTLVAPDHVMSLYAIIRRLVALREWKLVNISRVTLLFATSPSKSRTTGQFWRETW